MRTRLGRQKKLQILWKDAVARTLGEGFSVEKLREDHGCNTGCFLAGWCLLSFVNWHLTLTPIVYVFCSVTPPSSNYSRPVLKITGRTQVFVCQIKIWDDLQISICKWEWLYLKWPFPHNIFYTGDNQTIFNILFEQKYNGNSNSTFPSNFSNLLLVLCQCSASNLLNKISDCISNTSFCST